MPGNRKLTFALRNTFRRPSRLAVNLLALSAGGALLLTTHHTYESLMRVVDLALANQGYDVEVRLQQPAEATRLENIARSVPDVEIAEAFRQTSVTIAAQNKAVTTGEGRRFLFCGYPPQTRLMKLPLLEGRWPGVDESDAIVINRLVQDLMPGLRVGSELTLVSRTRRAKVRLVGLVEEIGTPTVYATFPVFETVTGMGDAVQLVRVKIGPGREAVVANALDQALLEAHLAPSLISTRAEMRGALNEHFAVVTAVMKMIALAAAAVGAISLVACMSLGVLERAREIGVLRALGATPRAVLGIFLIEGSSVAILSLLFSIAGSIYFARLINHKAATELLHVSVPFYFSRVGLGLLLSETFLVIFAVWISVRRLLGLSVREALAYE